MNTPDEGEKAELMTADDLDRTLNRMAHQVIEVLDPQEEDLSSFALIGMQTRGAHLARRLRDKIRQDTGMDLPLGILDVTMYRDDVRLKLDQPVIRATDIPFDVTGRDIVLIDDVVFTGRSARAALDALMDLGRPASIRFLVIVDRGRRELPISPTIVGKVVPTLPDERIQLCMTEEDDKDGVFLVKSSAEKPAEGR